MTFPSLFQKEKMGTNAGQAGGTTSDPATPIWTLLVWKLKTAGILFLHIIMLQGCYRAWNRHVRTRYINTFSSVMCGSAPMGQHLMEVSLSRLPYLPQTVCKEQRSRKGEKEGENSHRSKSHRTVGCVRLILPGSHKAHSQRFHLDRENQLVHISLFCFHFSLLCIGFWIK